ncbi:hypothetical protein M0R04_08870 [Candidatus Dojkabacteria bacterium]|jgi:hypothetical protein|nr:hypothetical protein [Candidatus Dojkabacteria bacterium]
MLNIMQKLVLAFVTIIVGLVLVTQVSTNVLGSTQKVTATQSIDISTARVAGGSINESKQFTPTVVSAAVGGWRGDTSGCKAGDVILGSYANASGTAYTDTTDIVRSTSGYFTLVNTSKVFGSSNVTVSTLTYCPDGYLTQGWDATILNLVPGFFALALMAIGIGLFYSVAREINLL